MEKKKILYVITKSNWGGAQRHIFDLATNLPKEDFEVVVALGGKGVLREKLEDKNIRVVEIKNLTRDINIFSDLKVFIDLIKILKKEKPNILHLHSSKIGGLGSLAGRLTDTPKIIFTVHGWAFNEERAWWQKFIIKTLSWITIILSHKTITVSEKAKEQVKHFPFVSKKITTIYNAIHPISFKTKEEARNILLSEQKEDKIWIGTIAELHKNKGLLYAIKAIEISNNPNLIFVIIGEGEEREKIEELIKMKELENKVFLAGHMNEASELLKAFDIFILPSLTEALGYVLLEAGLAELPVIASNTGGIPEIIKNLETGILTRVKDSKDISQAISHIINKSENSKIYKKNLKQKVETLFKLDNMIEGNINIYND
ncbi:glycosyltransferase [Patescibacteria group bacterium]|nr:glycosyltransferase [Patescibacteria group bacterium]